MLVVVSDSSPLIYLTRLGQLELLRTLHDAVFIPQAVWNEVVLGGAGLPESATLQQAVAMGWIVIRSPQAVAAVPGDGWERIGRTDAEALLLARELGAVLLTDDLEVRELAERFAVRVSGTIGLLIRAKREGRIPKAKPYLDDLRHNTNFRMSEPLYLSALSDAGEL